MARKKIEIELSAVDKASLVLKKMGDNADALKKRLAGLSGSLSGAFSGVGAAGVGAGVTGALGLGSAVEQAAGFEKALWQMTKVTDESAESIRQKMLALPASIGSVTDNTTAYYQVMSAGVTDAAQAMDTLTTASKLAAVAGVSSSDTIRALTKMMAGYRGEIASVTDASDLLLDMEQLGQTNVAELVPVIGDIASISQTAGVKAREMAAALSLLTQTAGSTAQAATQLKALENAFLNPNTELKKLLEALGYTDGAQLVRDKGLAGALDMIGRTAQANGKQLAALLGSTEALAAASGLSANGFSSYLSILDQVGQQAGRTEKSFEDYGRTFSGVMDESRATLSNFATAWGEGFLPVVKDALMTVNEYVAANRDTVARWGKEGGEALISLKGNIDGLLSVWNSLPEDITGAAGYGIIGAMLFGKKGAVLGLALSLGDAIRGSMAGFDAWRQGDISFAEYATSNREELAALLKSRMPETASPKPASPVSQRDDSAVMGGLGDAGYGMASDVPAQGAGLNPGFQPPKIVSDKKKSAGSGASQIASAREKIQQLREEIARLNGETSRSGTDFAKKLREIAESGTKAKLSMADIAALQEQYTSAFQTDALREFDKELATISGDMQQMRALEMEETLTSWKNRFAEMGLSAAEAEPKLASLKAALEQQSSVGDLQTAVGFYRELGQLSGQYNLGLEAQMQLIARQGQAYRQAGIPEELTRQWEALQRLELSTNPWDGMERAFRKYAASVQDGGAQMEQLFSGMFDAISSAGTQAFTELFTTGTLEVDKFFANLFAQLAQLAAQQAANALVGGILGSIGGALAGSIGGGSGGGFANSVVGRSSAMSGGLLGGMTWFGSGHTGAVIGSAGATPRAASPLAFAGAPRYHSGGMLGLHPDEVPFIGLRGERVLNPAETYAYNAGMARAGGDGGQMAEMVGLLRQLVAGQAAGAGSGGTSVVLVDDQRKVKDYLLSNDGQKTFVALLNNNRQAIQNVANGGRA